MKPSAGRRRILLALGAAALAPRAARAQAPARVFRIGFLGGPQAQFLLAFRDRMQELGYEPGRDLAIDYREVQGVVDDRRRREIAAELVESKADVIVASVTRNALAARDATSKIPIVMVNAGDPVEVGLTASLDRPSGNLTGLSRNTTEQVRGNLALLLEAVPQARRIGVLANPANPLHPRMIFAIRHELHTRRLQRHIVNLAAAEQIDGALAAVVRDGADGVIVFTDALFYQQRARIAQLALHHRLPTMFQNAEHVDAGGLMAYAPNLIDMYRVAAGYVDKLLRGAKPAELPIQSPPKFDLTINLGTAKALGIVFPNAVLERADRVVA